MGTTSAIFSSSRKIPVVSKILHIWQGCDNKLLDLFHNKCLESTPPSSTIVNHSQYITYVYIEDDLIKRRATLAFRARKLRGEGLIQDTWVMNYKIWVKDNRGRITQIYVEDDLKKFNPR